MVWRNNSCPALFHGILLLLFATAHAFLRSPTGNKPYSIPPQQRPRRSNKVKLGSILKTKEEVTVSASGSVGIDSDALNQLLKCESGTMARRILEESLGGENRNPLYGSLSIPVGASDRGISDGDLAIQTRIRNKKYSIMDLIEVSGDRDADRASMAVMSLTAGSTLSALIANQNLPGPEIVRFLVVWLFSFAPLAFVGYGIATPDQLQSLLVSVQRNIFPSYRKRMIQHEAGHFLMGHLLGLPIKGYSANAVKNAVELFPLTDPEAGKDRARQLGFEGRLRDLIEDEPSLSPNSPFFSPDGRGADILSTQSVFRGDRKNYTDIPFSKLQSGKNPQSSWPFRGFDDATLDKLTAVSVAGICAEILAFGNAEGGVADLSQLRQLFSSAEPELNERDVENRIRYALGFTMSQLRMHLGALDALAAVMERSGSVPECILAIETCSNVSGQTGILGDYELSRRQKISEEGVGLVERILLGGGKNAVIEEDRIVQGKGGGYRQKKEPLLTGDDPLYAAIAVSTIFFLWAASGGLSLH